MNHSGQAKHKYASASVNDTVEVNVKESIEEDKALVNGDHTTYGSKQMSV